MCHLYRLRIKTHVLTSYHALLYRATEPIEKRRHFRIVHITVACTSWFCKPPRLTPPASARPSQKKTPGTHLPPTSSFLFLFQVAGTLASVLGQTLSGIKSFPGRLT